jgi:hypothetical protein
MPLILVIDSNIWLAEQMLRHSSGSALRFFLRTCGARVALPEVVRREVTLHLATELHDLSRDMKQSYDRILRQVNVLKELVLPSAQELDAIAKATFENTRLDMLDVPLSIESARASFEKCITGEPPSGPKDQQFKDGVVWADCVHLAADNPGLLVTADKGFFRNRNYENGLAANLAAEAQATKCGVTVAHELASVLQQVRTDLPIDYSRLGRQISPAIWDKIREWVGRQGFVVGDLISGKHRLFATDDPAQAHLEIELSYRCIHPDEREGTLVFRGESTYSHVTGAFGEIQQRGEEFHFDDVDGQHKAVRAIYMVGTAVLGHRTVRHEIRAPLDIGS